MTFRLSEYGKHTEFKSLSAAIEDCKKKKLTDGEHGRLWIIGKNKKSSIAWFEENKKKYKDEYMILSYNRGKLTYIYDVQDDKWFESEFYWKYCLAVAEELSEIVKQIK